MIEIWVEDSTSGFRFLKLINKCILDNQYVIVPHLGNGNTLPNKNNKNGGIIYHLNNCDNDNLVILLIDKVIDNANVLVEYSEIIRLTRRMKNVKIVDMHSFEVCILSYINIGIISGCRDNRLLELAKELSTLCNNGEYHINNMSKNMIGYISRFSIGNTYSERVSKSLLSDITKTVTIINNEHKQLAIIAGGKIGPCWFKDCCMLNNNNIRKCSVKQCISIYDKTLDIVNNSLYSKIIKQIKEFTHEYITRYYVVQGNNDSENYYKALYMNNYIEYINKDICNVINIHGNWNYEKIFRLRKGKVK